MIPRAAALRLDCEARCRPSRVIVSRGDIHDHRRTAPADLQAILESIAWDGIAAFVPHLNDSLRGLGFAMAWGTGVALPTTLLVVLLIVVHVFRFVAHLLS
jgi:hypothetical protein